MSAKQGMHKCHRRESKNMVAKCIVHMHIIEVNIYFLSGIASFALI